MCEGFEDLRRGVFRRISIDEKCHENTFFIYKWADVRYWVTWLVDFKWDWHFIFGLFIFTSHQRVKKENNSHSRQQTSKCRFIQEMLSHHYPQSCRITTCRLHTIQWKHLKIPILLCRNFRNIAWNGNACKLAFACIAQRINFCNQQNDTTPQTIPKCTKEDTGIVNNVITITWLDLKTSYLIDLLWVSELDELNWFIL